MGGYPPDANDQITIVEDDGSSGGPDIQVFGGATCPPSGEEIASGLSVIDLGLVQQGGTITRTLTVKNADTATDVLGDLSLTPAGWYDVSNEPGSDLDSSLAAGQCDQFTITIDDTSSIGEKHWELEIRSTDPNEDPFKVELRAEVVPGPSTEPDIHLREISANGTVLQVSGSYSNLTVGQEFQVHVYSSIDKVTAGDLLIGQATHTVGASDGNWTESIQPNFVDQEIDYYVLAVVDPVGEPLDDPEGDGDYTESDESNNQALLEFGVFRSEGSSTVLHIHGADASSDVYDLSGGAATEVRVDYGVLWDKPATSGPPYWDVNGDGRVSLEDALLLASHLAGYATYRPWTNPNEPSDVNGQGGVTALDVLLLINEINRIGTRQLTASDLPNESGRYSDPDEDAELTAGDVLWIINYINVRGTTIQEGQNPAIPLDVNNDNLVTWDDWEALMLYLVYNPSYGSYVVAPVDEIHVRSHDATDVVDAGAVEVPVWVFGGPGADNIYGGESSDRLWGGNDDDVILGGPGVDAVFGESGDDCLSGGPAGLAPVQGPGTDSCSVRELPEARDDAYSVQEDQTLTVLARGVLANDWDPDPQDDFALNVDRIVQDVAHGTLTLSEDGSFVYTPDEGFYGSDQFVYEIKDGWEHSAQDVEEAMQATVQIVVTEVPSVVITGLKVEWQGDGDTWTEAGEEEWLWGDDTLRWSIATSPTEPDIHLDYVTWYKKPWDQKDDPSVSWADYFSGSCTGPECFTPGHPGVGVWAVSPRVYFTDAYTGLGGFVAEGEAVRKEKEAEIVGVEVVGIDPGDGETNMDSFSMNGQYVDFDQNTSLFSVTTASQDVGERFFWGKNSPGSFLHDTFEYHVFVSPNKAGIPLHGRIIDVDDPSDADGPIDYDPFPGAPVFGGLGDNRDEVDTAVINAQTTQTTGEVAVAKFAVQLEHGYPGDNFRGVFATRSLHLERIKPHADATSPEVQGRVFYDGDNDNEFAGASDHWVDPKLLIEGNAFLVGPMVTVWRRVHVELNAMDTPPAGTVFDDQDSAPPSPMPTPNTDALLTALAAAFIEPADVPAPSFLPVPFVKEFPTAPDLVAHVSPYRLWASEEGYLTRYVVSFYELWNSAPDNAPPSELAAVGTCMDEIVAIPQEVVRDVGAQHAWSGAQAEAVQRMLVVHEVGHTFDLALAPALHPPGFPHHVMAVPPTDAAEGIAPEQVPLYRASDVRDIRWFGGW